MIKPNSGVIIFSLTIGAILLAWYWLGPLVGVGSVLVVRGLGEAIWLAVYSRRHKEEADKLRGVMAKAVEQSSYDTTRAFVTQYLQAKLVGNIISVPTEERGH